MATPSGVLVIDDDAAIRELVGELLLEEGYQVAMCSTTAEAEAELVALAPALILLDLRLFGELSTDWLARRSLSGPALPPVVLMSAAFERPDGSALPAVVDVLAKPFDIQDLLSCVARHAPPPA